MRTGELANVYGLAIRGWNYERICRFVSGLNYSGLELSNISLQFVGAGTVLPLRSLAGFLRGLGRSHGSIWETGTNIDRLKYHKDAVHQLLNLAFEQGFLFFYGMKMFLFVLLQNDTASLGRLLFISGLIMRYIPAILYISCIRRNMPMPNQPAPDTTSILIRLPIKLKKRLAEVAKKLNEKYPDANYSAASIAKNAIMTRVEELEKDLKN